jgi:hypothetical protein
MRVLSKWLVCVLTVATMMFFTGCSKDEGNGSGNNSIVGTWESVQGLGFTVKVVCKADGTGYYEALYNGQLQDSDDFTYTINGTVVTVSLGFYFNYTGGNSFTISGTGYYDGTYTRK